MFSTLFEERDRKISLLVKLGDCLGRSLRENVTLFSVDGKNSTVTFLTENAKVISGRYNLDKDVVLKEIQVQDAEVYKDPEVFDKFVSEKISLFVENIHSAEYSTADSNFSDVLSLWDNRLKLSSVQAKLQQKADKLQSLEKIMESTSFQKLIEITPQLVEFLSDNFEKIRQVPEIKNAVNLSNTVSEAFNFPKLTYEQLEEGKSYILKEGTSKSIYEMICQQELVKKELIESKKEFSYVWASNKSIQKLSNMIFENDQKVITALSEAIQEVPYIALASKKSLFETFTNCLAKTDGIGVSQKDIQKYASRIFEYKKEVKGMFIENLNEKYGINIQNIQDPVSFKSLINTQVVILEALSRLAPKGTILKEILSENAIELKSKSGIEGIDVNDYIKDVFSEAGFDQILEAEKKEKGKANKYLGKPKPDLKRIAKDLSDMGDVIANLQSTVAANTDDEYSSDENVDQEALAAQEQEAGAMPPDAPPAEQPAGGGGAPMPPEGGMPPEVAPPVPQEQVLGDLAELESMVAEIAAELGANDSEEDSSDKKDSKKKEKKEKKDSKEEEK